MDRCSSKRSVCTNSSILLTAAIMEELLLFGCDSAGGTDGGRWITAILVSAVWVSVGAGRAESPLFDVALAECDTDLEDIFRCTTLLMGMSLLRQR